VLAETRTLGEATPRLLEVICESLGWEHGANWSVQPRSVFCVEGEAQDGRLRSGPRQRAGRRHARDIGENLMP